LGHTETYQRADGAWSEGLRNNDPKAIQSLYVAHFTAVRHFVLKNNGSLDDAKDMFQEAITVLWLKAKDGTLLASTEPGAFLFQVSKNKWLDRLRSASQRTMRVVPVEHIAAPESPDAAGLESRIQRLREVYDRMDGQCRNVLGRFYFQREDMATIAEALGVTEESIRTIKYRCMMKLRAFRKQIADGDNGMEP
jgi:RNA polymerase sigma factor (sigma-70 family)